MDIYEIKITISDLTKTNYDRMMENLEPLITKKNVSFDMVKSEQMSAKEFLEQSEYYKKYLVTDENHLCYYVSPLTFISLMQQYAEHYHESKAKKV